MYGVVKQSDGFVWVESALGEGATFELYLPQVNEAVSKPDGEMKPAAIARGTETISKPFGYLFNHLPGATPPPRSGGDAPSPITVTRVRSFTPPATVP